MDGGAHAPRQADENGGCEEKQAAHGVTCGGWRDGWGQREAAHIGQEVGGEPALESLRSHRWTQGTHWTGGGGA
jgi:hypothetical protein